jgi:signal transduction histidine kinase
MTLRARLTLFYTSILGIILIVFGLAVFFAVSTLLIRQVDRTLETSALDILRVATVDEDNRLSFGPQLPSSASVVVQAWDTNGRLVATTQTFNPASPIIFPLSPNRLEPLDAVYEDIFIGATHLRVLSLPIQTDIQTIGTLQAATNLLEVDRTRQDLVQILAATGGVALSIAALAGWFSTGRALSPLAAVTDTALQITRADDLSRRIPGQGSPDDEAGKLVGAFNQTMERMEKLFHAQRRFIADVSHELRTPLTVIKGNVGLMQKMKKPDEEAIQTIEAEVDRLSRLVDDLLLLAQAESGKLPMAHSLVELDTVLLEVFQQAHVLADGQKQLRIGDIDQVLVCGDADRLKQVLLNLISNAIFYIQKNGEVVVSLGKNETSAYVVVRDNGPGIPEKDLPFVFERFFRGEKARTRLREGKGFGLGLSIAHWIVNNHNGRIDVDSKEGQGTTFSVWLPLAAGDCQEKKVKEPTLTAG